MFGHEPGRGRSRGRTADITRTGRGAADLVEHPHHIGLDKVPASHIAGLFLAPDDLGLLESAKFLYQGFHRERVELLDPQHANLLDASFVALLLDVELDL